MNVSRFASLLFAVLLPSLPLAACSDETAEEPSVGGTDAELAFHGEVRPFDGVDLDTGMQPPVSPVQISLAFAVDGALTVDASAVSGGSVDAPAVAGKAGSGKQKIAATLKADAKLKVDFAGFEYDGPLPGMEALAIDIAGGSDFDPFLLDGSSLTKADVPETKLPPIPLPGGIPGTITLTIERGSFIRSDFHGVCASVAEGSARYVGAAKLDGELRVQATVEIKAGLSKKVDIPSFTLPIPARDVPIDLGTVTVKGGGATPTGELMKVGEACAANAPPSTTDDAGESSSSSGGSSSGGSSSSSGGSSSGGTSSSGGSSSGGSSGSSSGGSSSSSGGTVTCTAANTCPSPQYLGAIAGDGSAAASPLTATGTTAKWLRFRVSETDNGVTGQNLKVKATLTAPAGWTFTARMDTATDVASPCTAKLYSPTNGALTLEWGEGFGANGSDDSRYVVVDIAQGSGACPPSTPWSFKVERVP